MKHAPEGRDRGNSRNGSRSKTVLTEVGEVQIEVPRDRDGSFEPKIVAKRQRRLAGVDGLVILGEDDAPRPLLAVIEQSESKSLAGMVRRSLDGIDASVADALLLAISRAHERLTPLDLSRLLALPRRAVLHRLADAGFPPPQRLLTWGRLILAAHLLEDKHRSADRVALTLDFPSGSAFRNTCQRYLRATPGEVRAGGGAAFVLRALMDEVRNPAPAGASPDAAEPELEDESRELLTPATDDQGPVGSSERK